jgi:hypothetical protein
VRVEPSFPSITERADEQQQLESQIRWSDVACDVENAMVFRPVPPSGLPPSTRPQRSRQSAGRSERDDETLRAVLATRQWPLAELALDEALRACDDEAHATRYLAHRSKVMNVTLT